MSKIIKKYQKDMDYSDSGKTTLRGTTGKPDNAKRSHGEQQENQKSKKNTTENHGGNQTM